MCVCVCVFYSWCVCVCVFYGDKMSKIDREKDSYREREGGEGFYLHLKVVNPSFKTKLYF